jgi:hypothetical protein
MLTLVMTEVERMANDPLPVAQQPPSIAALERELDGLQRVEEVLFVAALATGEPCTGRRQRRPRRCSGQDRR